MFPSALTPFLLGQFAKDGVRFIHHGSWCKAIHHIDQFGFFGFKIPRVGNDKRGRSAQIFF